MVSEIFWTLRMVGPVHASGSALEPGILYFKLTCKTIYQYSSYQKNSEQSLQKLVRTSKILSVLGTPGGQP